MSPEAKALFNELHSKGVNFTINGDALHFDAPTGVITEAVLVRLRVVKPEIMAHLGSVLKVVDGNPSPPSTPSRVQIYRAVVRGKSMTILDPRGLPATEMLEQIKRKFGNDLDHVC